MTGVSKFSKASVFSGLNMLVDISLMPKYGNICGYTEENINREFKEHIDSEKDIQNMREWYNGYWFLKDKVYNPFDVLQYLDNKTLKNYWFMSGNPSFLIKLIEEKKYFLPNLSNLTIDAKLLDVFDIDRINIEVLLYQTGYLTIEEANELTFGGTEYRLGFPNKEVKTSFGDIIIEYLVGTKATNAKKDIYKSLITADINGFINTLKSTFATIPYTESEHIKKYEGFYASIVFAYLQALGINITGEGITNKGRIDITCFMGDKTYIMEFKVMKSKREKGSVLVQIKKKKYYEKYAGGGKEIYIVGMEFSEEEKNIVNFEWERV